ncbi:MAG: hypothetical protein ACPGU6_01135 [Tenacibaculum sp.]
MNLSKHQQYVILAIIFVSTYIIPLLLLIFLKTIGYLKSYQLHSIKERKIPLYFMIVLLFTLGKFFYNITIIKDLSYLFYGVSFGLVIINLLFRVKIKSSLHLLSMGSAVGFFLLFKEIHYINTLPLVMLLILLSGVLASARLHLKAHNSKEVFLGFFIGLFCPFIAFYIL